MISYAHHPELRRHALDCGRRQAVRGRGLAGAVWVANAASGTISRIDTGTNEVVATIEIGNVPSGIAVVDGLVWVTVQAPVGLLEADRRQVEHRAESTMQPTRFETSVGSFRKSTAAMGGRVACEPDVERRVGAVAAAALRQPGRTAHLLVVAGSRRSGRSSCLRRTVRRRGG